MRGCFRDLAPRLSSTFQQGSNKPGGVDFLMTIPDLEKVLAADRQARTLVAQAQEEAQSLLAQASAQVQLLQSDLQAELSRLKQTVQDDILQQAEGRAAESATATQTYIQGLQDKQQARREEAVALFLDQVLLE
jgi:vacuolar-type H+-ATPase subunit H